MCILERSLVEAIDDLMFGVILEAIKITNEYIITSIGNSTGQIFFSHQQSCIFGPKKYCSN